jgi:hypothetical protein
MAMEETETEIIDEVAMRNYKSDGTGMIYLNARLYEKLKPELEGKKLVLRFRKDVLEICMKPYKLQY